MGQRLVMSIISQDVEVATLYYHWSAYYKDSLEEVQKFLSLFLHPTSNHLPSYDLKLRCIRIAERLGGGIDQTDTEPKAIQLQYPDEKFKHDGISRNKGLVAITPDGMSNMKSCSEGDVEINLDDQTIYNFLTNDFESFDELKENVYNWYGTTLDESDVVTSDFDPGAIAFGDLDYAINFIKDNKYFTYGGYYYTL